MIAHEVCRPYVRKVRRDGSIYEFNGRLTKPFAGMYLDCGSWGLPPLNGITTAPLLRDDGTIRSTRGYDAPSGMWCERTSDFLNGGGYLLARAIPIGGAQHGAPVPRRGPVRVDAVEKNCRG